MVISTGTVGHTPSSTHLNIDIQEANITADTIENEVSRLEELFLTYRQKITEYLDSYHVKIGTELTQFTIGYLLHKLQFTHNEQILIDDAFQENHCVLFQAQIEHAILAETVNDEYDYDDIVLYFRHDLLNEEIEGLAE